MLNYIKILSLAFLVITLSACDKDKNKGTDTPAPVANAKPTARLSASNFEPREGSTFILDVSQSFDPDGDALTFTIEQRSGTTAQRSAFNGSEMTVTVPQISSDETAVFRVTANDGATSDTAEVTVTFINNDPPVARLSASTHEPREKSEFILDASASFDDETANLTFTFEQVSGPTVDNIEVNGGVATITAPEVSADTAAVFRVTVSDGDDTDDATVDITFTNIFRMPRFSQAANKTDTLSIGQGVRSVLRLPYNSDTNEFVFVLASDDPDTTAADFKITHLVFNQATRNYVLKNNITFSGSFPFNTQFRALSFPGMFGTDLAYIGFVPDTDEVFLLVISYDAATDTYTYSERGRFTQDITDINYSREGHRDLVFPWQPRPATSTPDFPNVPLLVFGQSTGGLFQAAPVFENMGTDGQGNAIYHMTGMEVLSEAVSGGPYYDVSHFRGSIEDTGPDFFREYDLYDYMNFGTLTEVDSFFGCTSIHFCNHGSEERLQSRQATYMPTVPSRPELGLRDPLSDFNAGYFYTDGKLEGPHTYIEVYLNFGIPGSPPEFGGFSVGQWSEGHPVDKSVFGGSIAISTPDMPELVMLKRGNTFAQYDVEYFEVGFGAEGLVSFGNVILVMFPEKGEIREYTIQ